MAYKNLVIDYRRLSIRSLSTKLQINSIQQNQDHTGQSGPVRKYAHRTFYKNARQVRRSDEFGGHSI